MSLKNNKFVVAQCFEASLGMFKTNNATLHYINSLNAKVAII